MEIKLKACAFPEEEKFNGVSSTQILNIIKDDESWIWNDDPEKNHGKSGVLKMRISQRDTSGKFKQKLITDVYRTIWALAVILFFKNWPF